SVVRRPSSVARRARVRDGLVRGSYKGLPLIVYALVALAVTWPTLQHFTTALTSDGTDARHHLWRLWHVQQALLGRQPLFYTPLLYFPLGLSVLVHGLGPVAGLFALPFWPLGPEAAYNGTLLIGLWLTGLCMYALARELHFERGVALFAGIFLMTSEIALGGVLVGHLAKTFLGLLPLSLLAWHRALSRERSAEWAVVTALSLLLVFLHTGWQFVLAVIAVGYFWVVALVGAGGDGRRVLLRRALQFAAAALVLVGPLLAATVAATRTRGIEVANNVESIHEQPDLLEFLLPSQQSRFFHVDPVPYRLAHNHDRSSDTAVSLSWTGIGLLALAGVSRGSHSRRWLLFALLFMLLSLGPTLKVFGQSRFTEYRLPIILPYAFVTGLPGLEFSRVPARFLMMGFVGAGIAASFGLARLVGQAPGWFRPLIVVAAIGLLLVERWPQPWPQERLRPVPQLYRQIAQDDELYGVFDLPIRVHDYPATLYHREYYDLDQSHYQMYQLTHRKGIAAGYLSRAYRLHPFFPCFFTFPEQPDILVDGQPVDCFANAPFELARYGYRYVVWHKPQPWYQEYRPGSWGEAYSRSFLQSAFGGQAPLVDDELTRVYAIAPLTGTTGLATKMALDTGWYGVEEGRRWARSPATLSVTSSRHQTARLEITPALMHDPSQANGFGTTGMLSVQVGPEALPPVGIGADRPALVPIALLPGMQTITLTLQAGNFRPLDYGGEDQRVLSFAIETINLRTTPGESARETD
ncbi:MAG TPA: hypothetical protein VER55_07580, partial [Ardenticatenaceae bacterium]|nr:hypothetical protein [Ardenticatenaceae bacterium]